MSNYSSLKSTINANIKQNGNEEITGPILNSVLNAMVDSLAGYHYSGIATPATNPGTPDSNVFYLASEAGTYTNFGGLAVAEGEVAILKYNGTWTKEVTGAATAAELSQLAQKIDEFAQGKFYGYFGDAGELPAGDIPGFAYVGTEPPFAIYNYDGDTWTDSGLTVNGIPVGNGEDIDFNADGLLQFANRVYDAQDPNGMGYVILRKDKTFAEQVTKANTIYEIRYDFTLVANFTMPAGCILLFNGGSILGAYTFTGTNTGVVSAITKIFGTSIQIAGTWNVAEAFPEWFGAAGDGVTDDTTAIKNSFLFKSPTLMTGVYLISQSVRFYNSINGNGASVKYGADCFLYSQDISDFYVRNLKIDGQSLSQFGIRFNNVQNVVIDNCTIKNIGNATIAQVSAINFMISSSCKNVVVQNCTITNVVYDNVGACSGIGFSNTPSDITTNNYGLYVSNCRFEGFNTSKEDSDCIKVLSDNGLDTHVVITGCFFTGIGKRAIKTQARGVKLIGNTYEVVSIVQAVVAFQRGYGESLNDTLIVNPGSGETSEYFLANVFELGYGNINISNFNTIIKNSVNVNGSHMMFANIGGFDETEFKGLRITNCTVGHVGFLLKFTTTTPTSDIDVRNVKFNNPTSFHNRFAVNTPSSLTSSKFKNIGILNSYAPLSNLDFSKIFNCSLILDSAFAGFGGSNFTTDNGNCIKITYDKTASNVAFLEYATGRIVRTYNYVSTNPGGLGSSKWGALRNAAATVGTILYKNSPTVSGDGTKIEMGYILTSVSGSSIGTTAVYSIPIS